MPQVNIQKNFAFGELAGAITAISGTLTLLLNQGLRFDAISAGLSMFLAIIDYNPSQNSNYNRYEIVEATLLAADTFSITRAQEGTAAQQFPILSGDNPNLVKVFYADTAANLRRMIHGQGAVVAVGPVALTSESPESVILTPVASINQPLPTTNVWLGRRFLIANQSASFTITIQASGGGTIIALQAGKSVVLEAIQDSPTLPAHWIVPTSQQAAGSLQLTQLYENVANRVLTGALALTDADVDVQNLAAAAAENITLPPSTAFAGRALRIQNVGSLAINSQIASVAGNVITTDQAAHGLLPGQSFRVTANLLGTGVLPANMALGTDYWVLTVPAANQMTIASSRANYEAGTVFTPGAYAPAAGGNFHGQIAPNQALLTIKDNSPTPLTVAVLPPGGWIILASSFIGTPNSLTAGDWTVLDVSPLVLAPDILASGLGYAGMPPTPNEAFFVTKVLTFGSAGVTVGPPSKITWAAHGISNPPPAWFGIKFVVGSGLPLPLVGATLFYPLYFDANTIEVALTPGGAPIVFTTAGGAGVTNTITPQFVVPPWVQRLGNRTRVIGGGGSGAGSSAGVTAGGGGGASGVSQGAQPVTPLSTLAVTVGPGGAAPAGGAAGNNGTDSTLVSAAPAWTMTGSHGVGGTAAGAGGPGGAASGGTENSTGGDGDTAPDNTGGHGGSNERGGSGAVTTALIAGAAAKPNTGGGGSGGGITNNDGGGAGADGQIRIEF